ncbi:MULTISPECIES: heparin lyase I family protein [Bradyrhizobium]|uniref:heparin lyase I family protein n=1 Tax=Bradyrhizobium TaxID=374 RepID=UPI000481630F|nr:MULTISPECIES: heparin lyase I family protein [Bradyrhizobium]UFW52815.1 polysaccharide lyase [Bradyrhizobium arachidis]
MATNGTITSFSSAPKNRFDIGGDGYEVQTAGNSYSLSNPDSDTLRFEVHSGDRAWYDGSYPDRSEIEGEARIAAGTPIAIDYQVKLEPNGPNNTFVNTTSSYFILGQMHNDDSASGVSTSPPFYVNMVGDKMEFDALYALPGGNPSNGSSDLKHLTWDGPTIVPGQYYDINVQANFSNTSAGYLKVSVNGQEVVNYKGPLGFGDPTYWEYGIYRSPASESAAVDYRNMTLVTGSAASGWQGVGGTSSSGSTSGGTTGDSSSGTTSGGTTVTTPAGNTSSGSTSSGSTTGNSSSSGTGGSTGTSSSGTHSSGNTTVTTPTGNTSSGSTSSGSTTGNSSSSDTSSSGTGGNTGTSSSGTHSSGNTTVTDPTGNTSSGSTSSGSTGGTHTTTPAKPTTPVAPTLTVADNTLSVSPGGSVSLGLGVSVPHVGDDVTVKISGLPTYETITDKLDGKTFSGSSITLTAAQVNSGLSLSSSYGGHGHPTATLTVTATDSTGTPITSAAQTITVKDPPATTSSGTSTTASGHGTSSGHHWHHSSHHHHTVAATSSETSTTTPAAASTGTSTTTSDSSTSSGKSPTNNTDVAQWLNHHPDFARAATTLSEAGASRGGGASAPATTTTDPAAGAGAKAYALLNQMMAGDCGRDSHFAQAATQSSASSQQHANFLTRPLH